MNVERIREYCLSLPHATEKLQWGETLCFKVHEKLFALLSLDVAAEGRLAFRCTPEKYAELVEVEGIRPARYNMWKYQWVSLEHLDVLQAGELQDLIRESHAIIAAKAKPKSATRTRTRVAAKAGVKPRAAKTRAKRNLSKKHRKG